jgi:hypothetical protein
MAAHARTQGLFRLSQVLERRRRLAMQTLRRLEDERECLKKYQQSLYVVLDTAGAGQAVICDAALRQLVLSEQRRERDLQAWVGAQAIIARLDLRIDLISARARQGACDRKRQEDAAELSEWLANTRHASLK